MGLFPSAIIYSNLIYKSNEMSTREKLVDAIIDLAGDEFQSRHDLIQLAKETEEQLVERLVHIAHYYKEETE